MARTRHALQIQDTAKIFAVHVNKKKKKKNKLVIKHDLPQSSPVTKSCALHLCPLTIVANAYLSCDAAQWLLDNNHLGVGKQQAVTKAKQTNRKDTDTDTDTKYHLKIHATGTMAMAG